MLIKFINRLLIKALIVLVGFIFVCRAAGIEPTQVIVQAREGYRTIQELKYLSNSINNGGDAQSILNQLTDIIQR